MTAEIELSRGIRSSAWGSRVDRVLAREDKLETGRISEAIAATFARRKTLLPPGWPVGLGEEFTGYPGKQAQWQAFLSRNQLDAPALREVVAEIRRFLEAPLALARQHLPIE